MGSVYGELAAGGELIALIAGGQDVDAMRAAKYLETLTPHFSKSTETLGFSGAMTVPLTWPVVVQLTATFGDAWTPGPQLQEWIDDQVRRRTAPDPAYAFTPAGLTPYEWQLEGAAMIASTGRALITDEPGTGKTITAILGLTLRDDLARGPAIIVCPASVVDPWVEAWQRWAPHIDVVAWRGPVRRELDGTAAVYVTSYDVARNDAGEVRSKQALLRLDPAALVVDECHLIKNASTYRSKAVRRLARAVDSRDGAIVALSGTPITHHPGDLWPSLNVLEPEAYPAKGRWTERYCMQLVRDYDTEILGLLPSREAEFRTTLLGQHRRVAKADVLAQLPPKVYSVRTVDMPTQWRRVYDDFETEMLAELPDGSELAVMDVMSKFGHLTRLASAAADVEVTFGPEVDEQTGLPKRHVHLTLKEPSWKVEALIELLDERQVDSPDTDPTKKRCEPVVVFAPSRQLVKLAGDAATEAGYRVGYVVGGQSAGDRTATIAAFQAGELDVICVTTSAGGVGITLTAARTVVFLQRPWSLVESIQAEDRCHRIGSEIHDSIEIVDIVARNTIDTRVRTVLRERAGQLADLVQDQRIALELLGGSRANEATQAAADLHPAGRTAPPTSVSVVERQAS